jgi:mannose-1-phosphate guanylyltransferase/phosphomannomutase
MDAMFAVARIYQMLLRQQTCLSEVVASLPTYHTARTRVPCPWDAKGKVMRILSQQYQTSETRQIDGVKIELGISDWVLVLPDTDRPLFHVLAESNSSEGAKALMEKYAALVSSIQK